MGGFLRMIGALAAAVSLLACSDGDSDDGRRQAILQPQDLAAKQAVKREQMRIYDAQGNLLSSSERVAGVLLPRGYAKAFAFDNEWYFDGPAPLSILERYVRAQLDVKTVQTHANGKIEFIAALPKGADDPKPTYVSVYQQPGRPDRTRLQIHGYVPTRFEHQDPEEVQAQINAARRRAD